MTVGFIASTAVGLSMDACAVAASHGLSAQNLPWRRALAMGAVFGAFQAAMPCIGYGLGVAAGAWIRPIDHWVALVVLGGIGGKMLWDAWRSGDGGPVPWPSLHRLLLLGLATSIDAMAAGLTFAAVGAPLLPTALAIGATTLALVTVCAHVGRMLGQGFGRWADTLGALVLIGLGAWICASHLLAPD